MFPKKEKKSFGKVFLIFLTSFILGVCFSFLYGNMFSTGMGKSTIMSQKIGEKGDRDDLDLKEFWEVYNILKSEYYLAENVEKKDIEQGIIKGLVNSLGDKHSEFMDPQTYKKFQEVLSGDFEGIGAVVEKVPLGVKVERILKGSPAKKAGILANDIIISANNLELEDLGLYDAVEKIKGDAGTIVDLKILRVGEPDFLEISVLRDTIQIPSVESEVLDTSIGYIALNMYGETTAQEFSTSLYKLIEKPEIEGLILDVRDNGGGYLQSAVEILSHFIDDGEIIVQTRYRDSFFNKNYTSSNDEVVDIPVVVLVNGNSASASEITAGALREYNKAILVGKKTYGKGSVQQPFDMKSGSLLKLTIAHWYTPKGKSIEENGIEPDIEIDFQPEDYENDYDRQLEEAKKILKNFQNIGSLQLAIDQYKNENTKE